MFPIHLAVSGNFNSASDTQEELRRLDCVKALIEAGAPLAMKDGNDQTVLHAAARAGHVRVLRHVMKTWHDIYISVYEQKRDSLNWRDKWSRTPVHWAVLNKHVDALRVLIEMGCNAHPAKTHRKTGKRSSIDEESPEEICIRLYQSSEVGKQILAILRGDGV
jgi:ankyrin repeat protein